MKFIFFILILIPNLLAEIKWKQIGMGAGSFVSTVEYDPFDENIVYMGSDVAGIFRSDNGGKSWKTLMNSTLDIKAPYGISYIHNIAFDPKQKGVVFILTQAGLFKSTDRGEHWKAVIKNQILHSNLSFSPFYPKQVLCGSGHKGGNNGKGIIFKSMDGGDTWIEIQNTGIPKTATIRDISFAPWKKDVAFAATTEGIFSTKNAGKNWNRIQHPGKDIHSIETLEFKNKKCIVMITWDPKKHVATIFRSSDAGETWINISNNLTRNNSKGNSSPYRMTCHKKTGDIYLPIYRGYFAQPGVWKGSNLGEQWTKLTHQKNILLGHHGGSYANCVAASEINPNKIIFGYNEAYRSEDGGNTWVNTTSKLLSNHTYASLGYEINYPFGIVFDPKQPKKAVAYFTDIGKWDFDTELDQFKKTPSLHGGAFRGVVHNVIFDPSRPNTYYASAGSGYRMFKPRRPRASATQYGKIVKVTRAGGREIHKLLGSENLPKSEPLLAASFVNQQYLYAAFVDRGVYHSKNGGISFEKVSNDIKGCTFFYRIYCFGKEKPRIFVITSKDRKNNKDAGLFHSIDHGKSWKLFFDASKYGAPYCMSQHPTKEKIFYVASAYKDAPRGSDGFKTGGGVYVTNNNGKSWKRILEQPIVHAVSIDQNNPKRLLAASSFYGGKRTMNEAKTGIYYSIDGGKNWSREKTGLGGQLYTFVTFSPFDKNIFYAGVYGAGIHKGIYYKN